MQERRYATDWSLPISPGSPLPVTCEALESTRVCRWRIDELAWDPPYLLRLLKEQPMEFDYVFAMRLMKWRSSTLILNGPFAGDRTAVLEGIGKHGLQTPGVYRFFAMRQLESAVAELAGRPDLSGSAACWLEPRMRLGEKSYRTVLEVNALVEDPNVVCEGFPLGEWRNGVLRRNLTQPFPLVPQTVHVPVQVDEHRKIRKVKPCREEMGRKLAAGLPVFTFRETYGHMYETDMELERLAGLAMADGGSFIAYGDGLIQYFRVSARDDTLYVVCLDRTIRMRRAGSRLPGSRPRSIHADWPGLEDGPLYLVEFDNGMVDVFELSFRAHRENEKADVPKGVPPTATQVIWLGERGGEKVDGGRWKVEGGGEKVEGRGWKVQGDKAVSGDRSAVIGEEGRSQDDRTAGPRDHGTADHKTSQGSTTSVPQRFGLMITEDGTGGEPALAEPAVAVPAAEGSQESGSGAARITPEMVGMALTLAEELDCNPRVHAPTHMTVLKMYCLDEMSVKDIEKECGCAHGTVMNRKQTLERRLGAPLEQFRGMGSLLEKMAATLEDVRARSIYRKGLVDDTGDCE